MMTIHAVVFDLDGTLLDTLQDIAQSANDVLQSLGHPAHDAAAYRRFIGDGVEMLFRRALPEDADTEDVLAQCQTGFHDVYLRRWNETTPLDPAIPELLSDLKQLGRKLCILSNKPHVATLRCVEEFLSDWQFDCVLGQRDSVPRKPAPDGLYEIQSTLGIERNELLYVGDSNTDMQTARNAEVIGVGVEWGFRDRDELLSEGASHVIAQPSELLKLLDGTSATD